MSAWTRREYERASKALDAAHKACLVRRSCIVNEIWWLVENSRAARQATEDKIDG